MTTLMYHDVVPNGAEDSSGFPGRDAAWYKVTPELFDAHLSAIRKACPDAGGLSFTLDDGGVGALAAADILERHGSVGHFLITTNYIGTRGFVTDADLRHLAGRGHRIGSHSCSHPLRMGHCSSAQLMDEWTRSRSVLSDILGIDVRVASVPGGDFAPQVAKAAARAGFEQLFTSEPTMKRRQAFGLTLCGRYTVQRWMTADGAAALAADEWLARASQSMVWNAKKLGKRFGGERYLALRRLLLRPGTDVQWGDQG